MAAKDRQLIACQQERLARAQLTGHDRGAPEGTAQPQVPLSVVCVVCRVACYVRPVHDGDGDPNPLPSVAGIAITPAAYGTTQGIPASNPNLSSTQKKRQYVCG